jgi:hypothetical protein
MAQTFTWVSYPTLQEGRFEEAALLRARQVELVEALTAAVDAGPRLPRVNMNPVVLSPAQPPA